MLGYGIDIWIASFIAALSRLRSLANHTQNRGFAYAYSVISGLFVSVLSGVFLHKPIGDWMGVAETSYIFVAVLVALTADSLMLGIAKWSESFQVGKFINMILANRAGVEYDDKKENEQDKK